MMLFAIGLQWKVGLQTSFLGKKTEATVKSVTAHSSRCAKYGTRIKIPDSGPCTRFTLDVDYQSQDGKSYSSSIGGGEVIGEGRSSDSSKYKINDKITIRYNPDNPSEIADNAPIFLTIVFFILIGIELLLIYFAIYPQAFSKIAAQFNTNPKSNYKAS